MYELDELKRAVVQLGSKGETGAILTFNLLPWITEFIALHPTLLPVYFTIHAVKPTEKLTDAYEVSDFETSLDGVLQWTVDATDTEIAGRGFAEIYIIVVSEDMVDFALKLFPFHTYVSP